MNRFSENLIPGRFFKRLSQNAWIGSFLACFLLLVLLATRQIHDADLGFHLKGGQWIVQNHAFPNKDDYTYTVPTHEYIDLHWLYQILLFALYKTGSYP